MSKDELIKLVQEFKNGDQSKFEDIYLATNKKLYNYIFSLSDSLNDEDCYELLQETYIQVNNKVDTLKECKAFYSWICTIARNKTYRYLDKKKKEVLLSEDNQSIFENQYEVDEDLLPEEILDSKEKQKLILDILNSLPEEQKDVIVLRYYNGLSVKEIASQLNISDGTVKSRLNYGRKKIESEVVDLEKKGTKLYCTSLPIMLLLLRMALGSGKLSQGKEQNLLNNIVGSEEFISHNNGRVNQEEFRNSTSNNIIDNASNNGNSTKNNSANDNTSNNGNSTSNDNRTSSNSDSTRDNISSDSNNSINNRNTKSNIGRLIKNATYTKFIAGGAVLCLLGGGAFIYSGMNKDNAKPPIAIEENDNSVEEASVSEGAIVDNLESVRSVITSYEAEVINIYEKVKFNNFIGKDSGETWEMDSFISQIELVSDGNGDSYYDSTYSIWANDIMLSLISELEAIIEKKEEISLLKDLNKDEEQLINSINEKIIYFIDNQDKFNELNDKLSAVISHGSSERAVEAATEFKNNFAKYQESLEKLKK